MNTDKRRSDPTLVGSICVHLCSSVAQIVLLASLASTALAATHLVAPFANRSDDSKLDWIGSSIGESVRASLEQEQVPVISRQDRERYAARLSLKPSVPLTLASLMKVSETAMADALVWGDYEVTQINPEKGDSARQLRITVRLYSRSPVVERLNITETGALEDLATLERSVAWTVFRAAQQNSKITRAEFESRHPLRKVNALENYVRGLMAPAAAQRHHYFTQAIRIEPAFDEALFELGMAAWREEAFSEAAGWFSRVSPGAASYLQALFLAGCSQFQRGDSAAALKSFSELLLREPHSPEVRNNLAAAQLPFDATAATETFAQLVAAAPGDPDYLFNYGYALWSQGQFEKAAELFRAVLDRTPNEGDSILMLGRCLKKSGPRPGDLRTAGLQRLIEDWTPPARRAP
jgi:Flp pilus assembly protein TadD